MGEMQADRMATRPGPATNTSSRENIRHMSPPSPSMRIRPLSRSTTLGDMNLNSLNRRRGSVLSDFSDTKKALKDSTDDLFLPRVDKHQRLRAGHESSNWNSIPLGLALLPAVGGLLFEGGSAVVTDITLLALAAVFLNWSVRVPWDWYHSAQAIKKVETTESPVFEPIIEEDSGKEDSDDAAIASSQELPRSDINKSDTTEKKASAKPSKAAEDAQMELRKHELFALFCCFIFPAAGAWLLHAIRAQLSRPSEGLVSNYNLTVFLLAAEIRPMSHLVKMVQARTLYLQKIVSTDGSPGASNLNNLEMLDLTNRLEELETYVADSAVKAEQGAAQELSEAQIAAELTQDVRKSLQGEVDALNRAVRRYEKRTTVSALQTEARIQELELRLQDALVLAAAAQRSAEKHPHNFLMILLNWISAAIVLPVQYAWRLFNAPIRAAGWVMSLTRVSTRRERMGRDGMGMKRSRGTGSNTSRLKEREKLGRSYTG